MLITPNSFGYVAEFNGHIAMASSISECISLIVGEIQLELDLI
jgi:hypothetical protein